MSRKFSIGNVASRSCCAARGASTRAPNARASRSDPASLGIKPERVGIEDRRIGISSAGVLMTAFRSATPADACQEARSARRVEGGRRLQVRQVAERRAGRRSARPGSSPPCAPSSAPAHCGRARRRGTARAPGCAARLARSSKPRGTARPRDRCAAGVARHQCRSRAPGRPASGAGPIMPSTIAGGELRHGRAGVERRQAVGDELLLEIAGLDRRRPGWCRTARPRGSRRGGGAASVCATMPPMEWPTSTGRSSPRALDRRLDIRRQRLEIHASSTGGRAP